MVTLSRHREDASSGVLTVNFPTLECLPTFVKHSENIIARCPLLPLVFGYVRTFTFSGGRSGVPKFERPKMKVTVERMIILSCADRYLRCVPVWNFVYPPHLL